MVGAAVLGGLTVAVLTIWVLLLFHPGIVAWSCPAVVNTKSSVSHAISVCSSQHLLKMVWVLSCAGIVGAVASGIGTSMLLRHRARLLHNSAPPHAPTIFR
jgi:hypothetical protein